MAVNMENVSWKCTIIILNGKLYKKKLYNYLITFVSKSTGEYKCTGVEYFNTKAGINKNV